MEKICVQATKDGMAEIIRSLTAHLEACRCSGKDRMEFEIAMEELLVNVVHYAYGDGDGDMTAEYEIIQKDRRNVSARIVITDEGIPYNPLDREDPDITLSAEERSIGGLGIFMARKFLDSLEYTCEDGKNCLTVEKNFETELSPVETMIYRYPQLILTPGEGMSGSEAYLDITRRGKLPEELPNPFRGSPKDYLKNKRTPAGNIEMLFLDNREDFERFVQVLAYRCENRAIPPSMGAVTIHNVNNWRKIGEHKKQYLQSGGTDWSQEFKSFTSVPENYKDTLVIAGSGGYSAISARRAGFGEEEWLQLSVTIRMYHEMSHVVLKRTGKGDGNLILEEVAADAVGICQAFGSYRPDLAKLFLGIEEPEYRSGGRLENYLEKNQTIEDVRPGVEERIEQIDQYMKGLKRGRRDVFKILLNMYEECF